MKKHHFYPLLLLIFLLSISRANAQATITAVDSLEVELWPDYDRPSVLVLLTGTLPANTPLPASVTIPLPARASLNAVARITAENVMSDDIQYSNTADSLTFTLPDFRFRVEYYMPYTAEGDQHGFTFNWQADFSVNQLSLSVQQPIFASDLQMEPTAETRAQNGRDGFIYHTLPTANIPANQPYTARVNYTLPTAQLSIEQLPDALNVEPVATVSTSSSFFSNFDWPLLIVGIGSFLITIAVTWQLATYRASRKPAPHASRPTPSKKARFCHECGTPLRPHDQFCRECGTAVKK